MSVRKNKKCNQEYKYLFHKGNSDDNKFELFFRKNPFGGEYAIVAGYDLVREILENFKFTQDEVNYLKLLPVFTNTRPDFFDLLLKLDLSDVEVLGLDEGEIAFPRLPILQIKGPILKTQLLESALLNSVNFATLIATYARRLKIVAGNHELVEFGMRRAQGPNGAMTATRASYLAGFDGTSNVLSGMHFQIPVVGTMAHSFVQSFSELTEKELRWKNQNIRDEIEKLIREDGVEANLGELAAFLSYAQAFPDHCLLLVDTYDTLSSGLPNAIRTFKILKKFGHEPKGIRLDSGDLVYLSSEAKKMLTTAGFDDVKIFASNELDEAVIAELRQAVVRGALVVHEGEVLGPPPKPKAPPPTEAKKPQAAPVKAAGKEAKGGHGHEDTSVNPRAQLSALLLMAVAFLGIGLFAPPAFLSHLTVFVLSCFVGWQVVWNVTPALHTPLMSVTNAISGIIIVGGMLKLSGPPLAPATILAAVAVLLSTINIAGGFLVTQRMLKMFRR